MNVITQPNQNVVRGIGGFQYRTKQRTYRMNKYCIEETIDDGVLIYNAFVGSLVFLKPYEYMNIYTKDTCDYVDFLVGNYFLVPEKFDEEALIDVYRKNQAKPITETYLDHPSGFTILTTTRCNARCFYCYEMASKHKTHMTIETAEKVAKYILEVAPPDQVIDLGWFGGEPLYNSDVIDIISSRIRSAGREIKASIISNGYLFDEKMARKAKGEWCISNAQITLDGTKDIYNKTKHYIYKDDPNPFDTVIKNIHNLINNGIYVSVRMNCDKHNEKDLIQLVKFLSEEFKNIDNFSMYVWPIFEEGFTRTPEERKELFESMAHIDDEIAKYGKPLSHGAEGGLKPHHCMVDSNEGITISPNGDIGLCEHYIDRDFISHIDHPLDKDWEMIKSWRNYIKPTEICFGCPLAPMCLKVHKCPDETTCDVYEKIYNIEHIKRDMKVRYELDLRKQKQQGSCRREEHSVWKQIASDGTVKIIQK